MTEVGKNAWILLFACILSTPPFTSCSREITTCNLYSTGECAQHCHKHSKDGKESCALTCRKHENGTVVKLCNQLCDPSDDNSKKCSFHCSATKECVQQCVSGHCRKMICSRNHGNCEQHCTGGSCKKMLCHSEHCFQHCRTGGCNMECGRHVKYCEQICPGGNCQIKCAAKICRAYCPTGSCDMTGPNKKIQTRCDIRDRNQCAQTCNKYGCYCKGDSHFTHCKQACKGKVCLSIACHSKVCRQNCGSNCSLTCSAESCRQECTGSGCVLSCGGSVNVCHQYCKGGGCIFNCAAKKCINDCEPSGTCIFNDVGERPGLHLDIKCDYRHNGQCEPSCRDCLHGEKDLTCTGTDGGKCNQNCVGGLCKNVKCMSANHCLQNCPGGQCQNMDCHSRHCDQRCSGGSCEKMQCTSENCTQVCLGNCNKMICNSRTCEQLCYLGRCTFECGENVTTCKQTCYAGFCNFKCQGKNCAQVCPKGVCFSVIDNSGSSSRLRYLYSILLFLLALCKLL